MLKDASITKLRGLNPLIGGIVLIGVTLTMAVLVGGWLTSISESKSSFIVNKTRTQLTCQYAGIHVSNVTYECFNPSCFSGVPYKINATIENTGSSAVQLSGLYITLDNGVSYLIPNNETTLSAGLTETRDFNSILITTDPDMPTETMDMRYSYINDSNTVALWHFNEVSGTSATDSATGNTGTLQNGTTACQGSAGQCPQWNTSGKFGSAITFDGVDDYVTANASLISNNTGTVEAWVNMHNNKPSNNYAIFSTPFEISSSDAGLVGLWHFSQNSTASGGVKDASPYGNNGTATNSPMFTNSGRFGTAWRFDGIDDYVNVPNTASLNITKELTATAWVYLIDANASRRGGIFENTIKAEGAGGYSGWSLYFDNAFRLFFADTSNILRQANSPALAVNRWYFVAAVKNKTDVILYVNEDQYTGTHSTDIRTNGNSIKFGTYYYWNPTLSWLNGTIDEVAIYNRSLSEVEIYNRYLGGLSLHKNGDNLRFVAGNASMSYNVSSWTGWHHVAGTYTSTAAALYADGASVNASSNNRLVVLGNNSYIGGFNGTALFNGTIDELRISNVSRNFTTNMTFNISHTNLKSVSVFNHTHQIYNINTSGSSFSGSLSASTSTDYRIEVMDTSNRVIRKYHPYRTEGQCVATSALDTVRVSTTNCPEIEDVYQGSDVFFANCPS